MLSWISEQFSHYKPDRAIAVRALRHMRAVERKNLFSEDIMLMRTAEGYWFEYLIYEQLIRIAEQTTTIKRIVRKGADVPKHREKMSLGVNGIYSAEKGDIRVRGNGQDLAEVDLLLFDKDKQVVFCEIVTSPADLKDLEAEIVYKKNLFGYMFNQEHVGFILFSSVDISGTQVVRGLVADPDNAYVGTHCCEIMKSCLKSLRITSFPTRPEKNPKLIPSETLKIRDFDYKKLHDEALVRLYFAMDHDMSPSQYFSDPSVSPLVKKVICGGLYPSAIKALVTNYGLRVKTDILDIDKLEDEYSKVILAVDFPEMTPVIYIKPKKQRTYLKMIPIKTGGFKYERPTPSRVGFYLWLEATKPSLGAERAMSILEYCGTPVKNCVVEPMHERPVPTGIPRKHHHPRRLHK
ncbi:MAG: hypothetical protein M0P20_06770 [Methanocorpusculum sp.]|jgi:hypothetical protein|nr:hypothetical protein [Methanocorpusculum sp.]MDD3257075.1 hypothetical protein [Methanocorpusculum sp.]MDD4132859.1 hypothetical protein [Methanocorpusculum sp.]